MGDKGRAAYTIGLWGDVPYSDVQANEGVPRLIADMNRQALAFSVHAGDIKSRWQPLRQPGLRSGSRRDSTCCEPRPCTRRATTSGPIATG